MEENYFHLFNFEPTLTIDILVLEKRYLHLCRNNHPDRHIGSPDHNKFLLLSSRINQAYTSLKDPLQRAEHLLKVLDGPAKANVEAEFLEKVWDLKDRQDQQGLKQLQQECYQKFESLFDQEPSKVLPEIRLALDRLQYCEVHNG